MIGALIGAGASLLGGLMGKKSAEKQAAQNIKMQKQFAQEGIQWKVKDAEKAGVHPLYALGAQTHSFSPVSVGDPLPGAIADMGQGIGRAVESGMDKPGRISRIMEALTVERAELENAKLRSEIALANQAGQPPGINPNPVIPGQQDNVTMKAHAVTGSAHGGRSEAGIMPEVGYVKTGENRYTLVMSDDFKQRTDEDPIANVQWQIRNKIAPMLGTNLRPPHEAPPGFKWVYNPGGGEIILTRKQRKSFFEGE